MPVAIIGVGLRLPGAETLDAFWAHLAAQHSLITEMPATRFDGAALRAVPGQSGTSLWGAFVADADRFDAGFFSISPREAAWMDPQQRFALELAWRAIEDAAIRPGALAGSRTGVFMGVCHWDYAELIEKHVAQLDAYTPTGIAFSIIANRVSHLLDLRGPSVANDTACAASMVALHDAVRALQDGSCALALAGGVNLIWSPNHFVAFSKNGMLSRQGRSRAFDAAADGYVRGEGGAMLLLKPLERALADGDPIHAVIRGIGTNHGGRTNSLTATNPKAQAELIAEVWDAAGVPPATVSFIEAHGPGTPLGDPIEIAGLKEAMRLLQARGHAVPAVGSCGIGSVKTNIGHLEGAAGVAGVVKILAALRHEALPPNAAFETLNSLITLADSPFRIQATTTPWPRGQGAPRRAAVSSFGFGGSNAHVLLEEASVPAGDRVAAAGPVVVPLSARSEERLRATAVALRDALAAQPAPLADIAVTLREGREAFNCRVALVVASCDGLLAALDSFLAGAPDATVRLPGMPAPDDELARAADAWVGGGEAAWPLPPGRRIHLPGSAFLRERYWFDETQGGKDPEPVPHPMLHRNVSRLGAQAYRSRFRGTEFFWAEHEVHGRQVMPGTACLEMARAAAAAATAEPVPLRFDGVVWARPILLTQPPATVEVALEPQAAGKLGVRITDTEGAGPNMRGTVAPSVADAPPALDLAALQAAAGEAIDPDDCYVRLRASGVAHGPMFQALAELRRGPDFVLARLGLPRLLHPTLAAMPLHPILLDAAIQAWVAFEDAPPAGAGVPFACDAVTLHRPCTAAMWACLRRSEGGGAASLRRLDILLCDRDGQVCVELRGLTLRILGAGMASVPAPETRPETPVLHLRGGWTPTPLVAGTDDADTTVLLGGFAPDLAGQVATRAGLPVLPLPPGAPDDPAGLVMAWVPILQAHLADIMAARPRRRQQTLILLDPAVSAPVATALAAMLRTAGAEHPKLSGAVIALAGPADAARLARIAGAERRRADHAAGLRYDGQDRRESWTLMPAEPPAGAAPPLDPAGAYWITGGGGALGRIFAEALAARGARRIVLSGRRAPTALPDLPGVTVQGVACDVADAASVDALVRWIEAEVGPLRGVIHAAGVLDDALLFGSDPARTRPVLAPKVVGACNLDRATAGLDLGFFVLFSSVAASFGNPGQAVYAAANGFLDGLAEQRAALVARGERRGATLAIGWPLWEAGGMGQSAAVREALLRRFGTVPLPTEAGTAALWQALAAGPGRAVVLHGERTRLLALLEPPEAAPPAAAPAPQAADDGLPARVVGWLKDLLSDVIGLEPARIRADTALGDYGLDSIAIVELTARMEQDLGPLSKTLFFEYVTLASLAQHLAEECRDALLRRLPAAVAIPVPAAVAATTAPVPATPPGAAASPPAVPASPAGLPAAAPPAVGTHDIAIVGLSLRVAGADDKDAFWRMLDEGRHAFGPVPAERWNHAALSHPERDVRGKTVVRTGAFLDDVAGFDPRYFRISQYEAELMSPEVRLFLQASVEAFEDAGYSRETLQDKLGGDVAVIVGSMTNEYDLYGFESMLQRGALASGSYTGTVPNMVSYFYGLTGPSYFLDTMCAASATCIHEAVHMLRAGRCRMALAGGVSLLLHPQKLIATSQEHFTSKTAEVIRGYGLGADGTILGEGVGAVVLKTLADAERDGDHIYAVIKGTGTSNAGVRNGFTVPSPAQQAAAIEQALADADIDPATISYLEGHGSGTALGDPIEVKALTLAWRKHTGARQFCPLGTVKSNVGHLLAASGLAGVAKVLMQMQHGRLAPSLHAAALNPAIPFEETPFFVQRESAPWTRPVVAGRTVPRRAGVTSIGAGGMNNHILLEEYLPPPAPPHPGGPELIVLSAMTPARLAAWAGRLRQHLAHQPGLSLADLAWTLQMGRNAQPCRLAFVAGSVAEAAAVLGAFAAAPGPREGACYTPSILEHEPVPDPQLPAAIAARDLAPVAAAWAAGLPVDWEALHQGRRPRRVALPTYPFEQLRCWYPSHPDAPSVIHPIGARQKLHPFIGRNLSDLSGVRFSTALHLDELLDYTMTVGRSRRLLPTAAIEMAAAAVRLAGLAGPCALHDLSLREPAWDTIATLEFEVRPTGDGGLRVAIEAADAAGARQPFAVAVARPGPALPRPDAGPGADGTVLEHDALYARLGGHGLGFKPYLLVLERARLLPGGGVLATLRAGTPEQDHFKRNLQIPPRLLGAAFQALRLAGEAAAEPLAAVERVAWSEGEATQVLVQAGVAGQEVLFLDERGQPVGHWSGLRFGAQAARPATAAPDGGRPRLQARLAAIAADILKFPAETLSARANFHDLGFDSVSLTHFAADIAEQLGVTLSPALFFQLEHLDALATHLESRVPAPLTAAGAAPPPMPPGPPVLAAPQPVPAVAPPPARAGAAEGLAIIGLALRVPGADTPEAFIDRLLAGEDLVRPLPLDRFTVAEAARLRLAGVPCWAGTLTDLDRFDAALFRVSPVEAERMDPRQRLILETAWRTLEDAGLRPDETPRQTGVFMGASGHDWAALLAAHGVRHDGFVATGTSLAMIANRVSHYFDWQGPSETIDTACSSSLVALARAAEALRSGACDMALVGGVNLTLVADGFEGPCGAGMLSPGGRCRSFAAEADGYVRGEGVVCVLLKPLAAARRDGDRIRGVLIGSAINHGGRAGALTAPSAKAQARLVSDALAGIEPDSLGYIEAHGTGTALGDPVEVNGLNLALAGAAPASIGLGSVKSAIGHLEAAAGLAGVAKVMLAMERGVLPPTLHCTRVNPHVTLGDGPLRLVQAREAWPRKRGPAGREWPRRAGVSSFGFGGANAHVVIEEGPGEAGRPALPPRPFAGTRFWVPRTETCQDETVLVAPHWVEAAPAVATGAALRRVVLDPGLGLPPCDDARVIPLPTGQGTAADYQAAATRMLEVLQAAAREPEPVLVQLAVPDGDDRALLEGLGAMLDTAALEAPQVLGQVIGFAPGLPAAEAAALLAREATDPRERRVRHEAGRRLVRAWRPLPANPAGRVPWRPGGVYLITGGLGGLGRLVAEDILRRAPGATLVLLGRAPLDAARQAVLRDLQAAGGTVAYHQADVADAAAVAALVQDILRRHGALHGVLHCAGLLRDRLLPRKSAADLAAVLAPKVAGALALEQACRGIPLERFVLFSSLAAAAGNPGQADYAAANGFLDALAARRGAPLLAVDWPLWREGGMQVDAATEAALFARMGQRPMATAAGIAALDAALAAGLPHVAVVTGEAAAIRRFFADLPRQALPLPAAGTAAPTAPVADPVLEERVAEALRHLLARISGVPAGRIEAAAPLEEYGIDSLMVTRLNQALGEGFRGLDVTLLFQHRSLQGIARHLVARHAAECLRWVGAAAAPPPAPALAAVAPAAAAPTAPRLPSPGSDAPIAIIGMSGRYPGAADLDAFWANLVAGRDMVGEVPPDRWPLDGFFHPEPAEAVHRGLSYGKWGAFLEGFAEFDPGFFRIAPRDAAAMDPQERLFLQGAWAACEDAGYPRARLADQHGGRVGVFAGVTKTGFALHGPFTGAGGLPIRPGTSFASVANRVSHALDLHGPSLPVDTMCSASLTAIHAACEALRAGTCELALAGGVNLYLHPSTYVELSAARMLSPKGRCHSFGAGADGFVPGEGVGCLLLKPLDRALADGDRIHAVIRATAVNHGGHTSGYTVPNPTAQAALVRDALHRAGLRPGDVTCIEAHGTGTDLGDPIEVAGLTQAFEGAPRGGCALGSVKSAIGHLEAAAGIAGVTKVVLQMRHRMLAPTLHAETANPKLDLGATPFFLSRQAQPWTAPRRIAGVSSFGAGGANAHVILEEPPAMPAADAAEPPALHAVPLSARDPERLRVAAGRLLACIETADAGAAMAGRAAPADLLERLRGQVASLLGVEPAQVDEAETLDAMGFERVHLLLLQDWLGEQLGTPPAAGRMSGASTLRDIAALCGAGRAGAVLRLADIAYTLQVGREPMEARLAIEAASLDALAAGLRAFLDGQTDAPGLHVGTVGEHRALAMALNGDAEGLRALTTRWMQRGSLGRLLELWVKGVELDWTALPRPVAPRIVSLPTYPFRQERFWLGQAADPPADPVQQAIATVPAGGEALGRAMQALEEALAPLVRAVVAAVPPAALLPRYAPWREALERLVPMAPAGAPEAAWADWTRQRATLLAGGSSAAQATFAEAALRALPEILTGAQNPTAALFPAGSLHLAEAVYAEDPIAARCNANLAAAAAAFVAARPGRQLRVLEIGAGTGSTTAAMLRALGPLRSAIAEYRYTDVSRAFLIRAERRFAAELPGLRTTLFDVERGVAEQGLQPGAYDLVIAANVLHATADIVRTLWTVREAMAPGGLLLLNETSRATLFTHVTFGLLEGWWRATDPERRIPGTPSLTAAAWRAALEEAGFRWRAVSPEAEQALGQQLIAAEAMPVAAAPAALPPAPMLPATERPLVEPRVGPAVQPAVQPLAEPLVETVRRLVAETLNVQPAAVALDASFADYGLDSILGAELVDRLRRGLGVAIEHTQLFDSSTVARLAESIGRSMPAVPAAARPSPPPAPAAVQAPPPAPAAVIAPAIPPAAIGPATAPREPIAIVGMSGRFAAAPDVDALWDHLLAGRDLVAPCRRPGIEGRMGSFLDAVDRFDPQFFGISGVEARYMDPQQRLFLEEAWKTLEHAGHAGAAIEGRRCGVFVGASAGDYHELFRAQPPGQAFWGNTSSLIPARIAYFLNLKGPALAVDTACSSSLVALHLACQSLWNGESEMALAGGVFVQCTDRFFRYAGQAGMLSASGRCAAFGATADGIVPGEAVAAVLLRPLGAALADGDTIHGLILGTGANQDGATNGITAPSADSQERLMREVHAGFGIDPAGIDLVEAHGTGTPLGDPIEYAALARVFAARATPCLLGSVKANIGHATTAAGIAGLVKLLLALRHRTVPPAIHFDGGNPAIRFTGGPLRVNATAERLTGPGPHRAAISSFGFSGTNAHAVIEAPPPQPAAAVPRTASLVVLSGRTAPQLRAQAERLAAHLAAVPGQACADIAFTLMVGRRHLPHRLALVARDTPALLEALRAWLAGQASDAVVAGALDPKGQADDPARLTAGASLIAEARAGREAALHALARAFVAGDRLDYAALLPLPRRRLPLPTHAFAADRHWVPEASESARAPAVPVALPAASPGPAPVAAAPGIRLADPARPVPTVAASPRKVTLAATADLVTAEPLDLRDGEDRHGVRAFLLRGAWAGPLAAALAGIGPEVRAVLLRLGADAPSEVAGAVEAVRNCPVPVVAALPEDCTGAALRLALACDFVVLAEEGRYGAIGPAEAAPWLAHRLGAPAAALRDGVQTGAALQAAGLGLPVVAGTAVPGRARELAQQIAEGPRDALVALARHMRAGTGVEPDRTAEAELRRLAAGDAGPVGGSARRVALRSDVVALEAFEDGVALLRMRDLANRNMFTDALMDGLEEAFAAIGASPEVKAVVLSGAEGFFASGGTRDGLRSLQQGATRFTDRRIYSLPLACPVPVLAAMDGHAIGAGWSLGMFCDLRLFGAESVFHSNYLSLGFTPGAGATLIFPSRLGDGLGREVLFTAAALRGRDLAARSVAITALPNDDVLAAALAHAHALARAPRPALLALKAALARPLAEKLEPVLAAELAMHRTSLVGNAETLQRIEATFGAAPALLPVPPAPGRAGRDAVRAALVASLGEELMIEPAEIRDDAAFLDLGLDSILAVTWIRRLNAQFGTALPATAVYGHPTVGALADHVATLLAPAVTPAAASAMTPAASAPRPTALSSVPPAPVPPAPVPPAPGRAGRDAVRAALVASLGEELMIEPAEIRDDAAFLDLGLDSILAVTWIRRLNAQFGTALPATAVYGHPTVGALADHVATLLAPAVTPAAASAGAPAASAPVPSAPVPSVPREVPGWVAEPPRRLPAADAAPAAAPVVPPAPLPAPALMPARLSGTPEPIAIIGASGRFPKAPDLGAFWENIRTARDCIDEVPPERWDIAAYYDPDPQAPGKTTSKWLGAIDRVDRFDPAFFNITPREAELMDPQQRLFLQHAWHAIEDAGLDPVRMGGSACGVFVGSGPSGYADLVQEHNAYSLLGSSGSILAARIAYLLDLRGPTISLDTACSSSLVAIVQACNSLLLRDCDLALAGGACVLIGPSMFIDTSKVGMLSPDGRCFAFDHRANGFVPGEGVGVLMLKRLADAERDGDPVRAVIRGWGVNQDGRTNGITAPNPEAQARLIRGIHERFGIAPGSIDLVECHGTGTALGDPIEIEGLTKAFVPGDRRVGACAIGSVKSNVGHLLASAGVAGAMKAMLALQAAELPPTAQFERANPHLALAGTPFAVSTALRPWPAPAEGRRRAAVSSFGFSGTNAHLVLEEAPPRRVAPATGPFVLPVAARTPERLRAYAARLADFVAQRPAIDLQGLAATFQAGRTPFPSRLAVVFADRATLLAALEAAGAGRPPPPDGTGPLPELARRWCGGEAVAWPGEGQRLHAPGYPFAEQRCWVEPPVGVPAGPAAEPVAAPVAAPAPRLAVALEEAPGLVRARLTVEGGSDLLAEGGGGLALPLLARLAVARAAGRPPALLSHLVWGRPPGPGAQPRLAEVSLHPGADGTLFGLRVDGAEECHLGTALFDAGPAAWPAPPPALPAEDVTAAWRRTVGEAAEAVTMVRRDRDGLAASLVGRGDPDGLDPALLQAIAGLIACHAGEGQVPFAAASLRLADPLPPALSLRLWQAANGTLTLLAQGPSGAPVLLLDGLLTRPARDIPTLSALQEAAE